MARQKSALRRRDVGPGFWTNEDLVELGSLARLYFMAMWCQADREGRLEDRPGRIRLNSNMTDITRGQADQFTAELNDGGFIIRYEVNGERFIQIINFHKHQKIHPKEAASTIPPPKGSPNSAPSTLDGKKVHPIPKNGDFSGKSPSEPSEPSEPSGEREKSARAPEPDPAGRERKETAPEPADPATPRSGADHGLPPEAANLATSIPATVTQMDHLATLGESLGVDPIKVLLAETIYTTWTKRSAGLVISILRKREAELKAKSSREPPRKSRYRDIDQVMDEIDNRRSAEQ